jgi:hypothetical protein
VGRERRVFGAESYADAGILLSCGMATPKKTAPTKPAAPSKEVASKPAPSKPATKAAAPVPARKPTQLDLMLAAQAKKRAEGKGKPAPSAKGLGTTPGGSPGHANTHTKGGAVGVARRTAPGA